MTPEALLEALELPAQAMLGHRVPKTLLVENGAPTAADRRQIENGIEELRWVATLKPTTIGVAAFEDDAREAVELAVLTLRLRARARLARLVELVHRAIPYHLVLITAPPPEHKPGGVHVSLADKRWSQNERDRVVLDGNLIECAVTGLPEPVRDRLLEALSLARQPRGNLYALYRGWIDTALAANAAAVTGEFRPAENEARTAERAEAIRTCAAIERKIASLRAAASKEKQLARRVEFNTQLKDLRAQLDAARARL